MKEARITSLTKTLLDELKLEDLVWYYKVSDRFTSGLADFIGCFTGGRMFHIELKAPGERLRTIQAYTLYEANKCHASVLGTDSFDEVVEFVNEGVKKGRRLRNKPPTKPLSHFLDT